MRNQLIILFSTVLVLSLTVPAFAINTPQFDFKFGVSGSDPADPLNGLDNAHDIAVSSHGTVYVADFHRQRIAVYDSDGNYLRSFAQGFFAPGVSVDSNDNILVPNYFAHNVRIYDSNEQLINIFSPGLRYPYDIAEGTDGNYFITDSNHNRVVKISPTGAFLGSFAGFGSPDDPLRIDADDFGNLIIGDGYNGRIRIFDLNGVPQHDITSANGPALVRPEAVTTDDDGNVYVADVGTNQIHIYDIAGHHLTSFGSSGSGDGEFNWPWGMDIGINNEIFVVDSHNDRIQVFTPALNTVDSDGDGVADDVDLCPGTPIGTSVDATGCALPSVCVDPPTGMIGWWDGDSVSGTTASDIVGNNDGNMLNGVTIVPGKVGNAFHFDGIDDTINIPGTFGNVPELTIDAWIKTDGTNPSEMQAIVSSIGFDFVHLQLNDQGGNNAFFTDVTGGNWINFPIIGEVPNDVYRHVAISLKSGDSNLYVDGVLIGHSTHVFSTITPTSDLHIGSGFQNTRHFIGDIDEVELFNRALSQSEIQSIVDAGSVGKCKVVPTDTTAPTLTVPADVTLEAPADTTPANTGTATATDDVDPSPTVTYSDVSVHGTGQTIETITRTWTATDSAGNSANADQIITVVDTTPPVITVLGESTVTLIEGQSYVDDGATATDVVDGSVPVTTDNPVDANVADTYTVTYTATDNAGNAAQAIRTVIVQSAAEASESLLGTVEDLNLPPKIESKLTGPVDKTITFLNDNNPNNDNGSCGQLNAFKVEVAKPKNGIDQTTQDELIAIAEAIQNNLDCSN